MQRKEIPRPTPSPIEKIFDCKAKGIRDQVLAHLQQKGWVCFRIMSEEVAAAYLSKFIEFVKDHKTRGNEVGIVTSIAHTDFAWEIRLAALPVFALLYDTSELLTSYDGGSVLPPKDSDFFNEWFHTYQSAPREIL
jgi:hypothetical protein